MDTRGTKISDVGSRHSERFHPYARGSNDRSKYDDGQSRERRFERSPPREPRDSRDPREYRDVRDPREREVRDPRGYSSFERPTERRFSPPPSERRPPPPEYYRGAVPMRDYPPVQRGRSPERAPVRYGAIPERRMPDPRMDNYPPRTARGGSDYYMDRRIPAQSESYRRSPEPAYIARPRSRSPPDHYRDYRAPVPPSDVYPRGRSPERMARPVPQRGPEVRRGRSPDRYPEPPVETRRYSGSPPPAQEYRGYNGERFRNERRENDNNDYGRGRRERRTPDRIRNDGESFGSGKRPLTPESKPDDGRAQTP